MIYELCPASAVNWRAVQSIGDQDGGDAELVSVDIN